MVREGIGSRGGSGKSVFGYLNKQKKKKEIHSATWLHAVNNLKDGISNESEERENLDLCSQ